MTDFRPDNFVKKYCIVRNSDGDIELIADFNKDGKIVVGLIKSEYPGLAGVIISRLNKLINEERTI